MKRNLIFISPFCHSNNTSIEFLPSSFFVKDLHIGTILLQGRTKDGVQEWPMVTSKSPPLLAFSTVKTNSSEWHHRLGHPSSSIFKHILSSFQLEVSSSCNTISNYNACQCNKSHKLPFSMYTLTTTSPLEVIFSDVWNSPIQSIDNFKYYVLFVLKRKSHVFDVFVWFKSLVENPCQRKIVTLYFDNRGEYQALSNFLDINGVFHFTSPSPHTHQSTIITLTAIIVI